VALLTGLAWSAISYQIVQAHAALLRSLPEADARLTLPPDRIELWFSEPLETGFSTARLLDSSGREISNTAVIIDPDDSTHMILMVDRLEPGVYTVAWQTLSQVDGHPYTGSFPITLLNPDGSSPTGETASTGSLEHASLPSAPEILARWCWLLGCIVLFGAPWFQFVVAPAGITAAWRETDAITGSSRDLGIRAVWIAVVAVTIGQAFQLGLQAFRLGGASQFVALLLNSRSGALMLSRQALAFTMLIVTMLLPQPRLIAYRQRTVLYLLATASGGLIGLLVTAAWFGEPLIGGLAIGTVVLGMGWVARQVLMGGLSQETHVWKLLAGLAGGMLLATATGSHAGAGAGGLWAVFADLIHLGAAGTWIGGLLLLATLLWQDRVSPKEQRRLQQQAFLNLIRRFSYLASVSVYILALSGVFNSLVEIPRLTDVWETAYGQVLLIKLSLIGLSLGVAFLNNRLVHTKPIRSTADHWLPRLTRQVLGEAGLAIILMFSVAVLVQTPAPRSLAPSRTSQPDPFPFTTVVSGDDLYMYIQVDPNRAGNNTFWLHIYHGDGSPIGEVQLAQLRFNYIDQSQGQSRVDLQPIDQSIFSAQGAYLNRPGAWEVTAYIRRRDMDDNLLQFDLDVRPTNPAATGTPWQNPVSALPASALVFLILLGIGAIPLAWRHPLQATWPNAYRWFRAILIILVLPGLLYCLTVFLTGPDSPLEIKNPVPPTGSSISQGQELYVVNCLSCHGPTGLGDGPAALTLFPRPSNLRAHTALDAHSDAQFFRWITDGYPGSAMPAFGEKLTVDQRWHLVNYIRTFANQK
jgi:copper transport protein